MKNTYRKILLAGLLMSLVGLMSACSKEPKPQHSEKKISKDSNPQVLENNNSLCSDYGNLKKAVAKLITERSSISSSVENLKKVNESSQKRRSNMLDSIAKKIDDIGKRLDAIEKGTKEKILLDEPKIISSCVGAKPRSYYVKISTKGYYQSKVNVNIRQCPYPKVKL